MFFLNHFTIQLTFSTFSIFFHYSTYFSFFRPYFLYLITIFFCIF
jgi:hypothetical protein